MSGYTLTFLCISQNKLLALYDATPEALAPYDRCTEIELYEILDTKIQSSQDIKKYNTKLVEILISNVGTARTTERDAVSVFP